MLSPSALLRASIVCVSLVHSSIASAQTPRARPSPTSAQLDALRTVEAEVQAFQQRAAGYRSALARAVEGAHERDLARVRQRFERQISSERALEAGARRRAIAVFERFVREHPNEDAHTPDVLLRLAELYFDEARGIRLEADEQLDRDRAERERLGRSTDDLRQPEPPDYRCSIIAYRDIVQRFERYPRRDAALYLLGWVLRELGHDAEALSAYRSLVCAAQPQYAPSLDVTQPLAQGATVALRCPSLVAALRPFSTAPSRSITATQAPQYAQCSAMTGANGAVSRYAAEVWYAIGDQHFDDGGDLDANNVRAIAAYTQARALSDAALPAQRGAYWARAQYKIGWSNFRRTGGYSQAIREFAALLDHIDAVADRELAGMRTDALRWVGVILSESEWSPGVRGGDPEIQRCQMEVERVALPARGAVRPFDCAGILRVQTVIAQDRSWSADAWIELGDDYFQQTKYYEAIALYRLFVRAFATHPAVATAHARIAESLRRMGLRAQANAGADAVSAFDERSAWAIANGSNREALRVAWSTLRTAALDEHERARALRLRGLSASERERAQIAAEARAAYAHAATLYERTQALGAFVVRAGASVDPDELAFNRADALFWAERYEDAARAHESIRERSDGGDEIASAAYMASIAHAQRVLAAHRAGAITACDALRAGVDVAQDASNECVARASGPVPAAVTALIDARAAYRRVVSASMDRREGLSHVLFDRSGVGYSPPFRAVFAYRNAIALRWFGRPSEGESALRSLIEERCDVPVEVFDAAVRALTESVRARGESVARDALLASASAERSCPAEAREPQLASRASSLMSVARGVFAEAERATMAESRPLYERAAALFERSMRAWGAQPSAFVARYYMARSLEGAGRSSRATQAHEQNLAALDALDTGARARWASEDPTLHRTLVVETLVQLAEAYRRTLDDDAALRVYERVVREPVDSQNEQQNRTQVALQSIAMIYDHRHDWDSAARAWQQLASVTRDASARAEALYREASARAHGSDPASVWRLYVAAVRDSAESAEWRLRAQRALVDALTNARDAAGAERERDSLVAMFRASRARPATVSAAIVGGALVAPLAERVERFSAFSLVESSPDALSSQLRARAAELAVIDQRAREIVDLSAAQPSVEALSLRAIAHERMATQQARVGAVLRLSAQQERSLAAVERQALTLERLATTIARTNATQADALRARADAVREQARVARESIVQRAQAQFDAESEAERILAVQDFLAAAQLARRHNVLTPAAQRALEHLRQEENRALITRAVQAMNTRVRESLSLDERAAQSLVSVESAGQSALASDHTATPGLAR